MSWIRMLGRHRRHYDDLGMDGMHTVFAGVAATLTCIPYIEAYLKRLGRVWLSKAQHLSYAYTRRKT